MDKKENVFIIGHRNPDTDSICSAISYAYLKNKIGNSNYIPMRAGEINEETSFVLKHFNCKVPDLITDVGTQVKDLEISSVDGISENISLKKAWNIMEDKFKATLVVTDKDNKLDGIITLEDIATSYMNIYESNTLATARTPYENVIETINGTLITGDVNQIIEKGKVFIATANSDLMEEYIEKYDVVITGNRYESQLCAIEMGASCIIICEGAKVSKTITNLAKDRNCLIITTNFDTFTVARLIHQSIPVSFFKQKKNLITFKLDDFTNNIKDIITKNRRRDFPILKDDGTYIGMISRRNLISPKRKKVIIVDHNEVSQAVKNIEEAEILEIIDHHRIGTLETVAPAYFRNQPVGCTSTIIYQMFVENNVEIPREIAGLMCSAIISDTLLFRSPTCTALDEQTAKKLAEISKINLEEYAFNMFRAGSDLAQKSAEEISKQDFKKFTIQDVSFGVGQINSMDYDEEKVISEKLSEYLQKFRKEQNLDMIFFMITNILDRNTRLIYFGKDSKELVEKSFNVEAGESSCILKNVVSRKKQLIPQFAITLQGE
ncbi:putative manganese-dependent inorganic diphosphatase [uncultured Parvimonas sp.]|uniref:putative manganese-dependent inorganic diphosphatase n=1 Tax=uncultured Parvimonas sp. TaxID=747372 RepID=UPI0025942CC1|nr:putative manganese-dependent inorganic diphosphatase [uncultured Parvimonas sp.]